MRWSFRIPRAESKQRTTTIYPGDESTVSEAQRCLQSPGVFAGNEGSAGMFDTYRALHQVQLNLEVDDGQNVPVMLDESNAASVIDATQCLREYIEREKMTVPPVYNFGCESSWSSTGD